MCQNRRFIGRNWRRRNSGHSICQHKPSVFNYMKTLLFNRPLFPTLLNCRRHIEKCLTWTSVRLTLVTRLRETNNLSHKAPRVAVHYLTMNSSHRHRRMSITQSMPATIIRGVYRLGELWVALRNITKGLYVIVDGAQVVCHIFFGWIHQTQHNVVLNGAVWLYHPRSSMTNGVHLMLRNLNRSLIHLSPTHSHSFILSSHPIFELAAHHVWRNNPDL